MHASKYLRNQFRRANVRGQSLKSRARLQAAENPDALGAAARQWLRNKSA